MKSKHASNQFTPDLDHLVRCIGARYTALPTVGCDAPRLLIQLKLSVLCACPKDTPPNFLGVEAVIYVPVNTKLSPIGRLNTKFLADLNIELGDGDQHLKHSMPWFVCQFAEPNPIMQYQSIKDWRSADPAQVGSIISRVLAPRKSLRYAFGLKFYKLVVTREQKSVEFHKSPLCYHVLMRLAQRYPEYYDRSQLCRDAWIDARLPAPTGVEQAIESSASRLRTFLPELGLKLPRSKGSSYRLEDELPDNTVSA